MKSLPLCFIKKCVMKIYTLFCISLFTLLGCHQLTGSREDESADRQLNKFATAYFNYDLVEAANYVTPESMKWLQFLATNITQEDLDLLNQTNEASIEGIDYQTIGDTTRTAVVTISNYFVADSLEGQGHQEEQQEFLLHMVKRDGKWLVRMEGLPQNEKPSHD